MDGQPWVEKYRPTNFEDIVLDKTNKTIFNQILNKNYFPNLLLYGPPGTGKTTTIINLINKFQKNNNNSNNKDLIIHLNASDDRGVDIVRNQINQFVNTKTFFNKGLKFIILDEVDYMTKNAQSALRYLIQQYSDNIRFCLICNYISRIDNSLQNEFVRLKFCNLPKKKIIKFLEKIVKIEGINIKNNQLVSIQNIFNSDMRSMINFLQSNCYILNENNFEIISNIYWEDLIKNYFKKQINFREIKTHIKESCIKYNIRIKNFIVNFITYIIHNHDCVLNKKWLNNLQIIIHYIENDINEYILNYFTLSLLDLYKP
jgi:DNA polymerase III delta prime subunit